MARGRGSNAEPEVSDSGDEGVIEEAFAPGRRRVGFEDSEDSLDEQAVYDLSEDESEDESGSEDEDEDDDDEPDLDEEIERGGRVGRRE